MITILVAAGEDDKDFLSRLSRILDKHFVTVRAYGQKLESGGASPELMLGDLKSFKTIDTEKVIVVYKKPEPFTARVEGASLVVAIVDSSDTELLGHVSATRLPAITCGLRSRDTITLSSMAPDSAVIDLRRCINCLDASRAEPQEIPLHLENPLDSFLLMAAAAIFILLGKTECLKEGFI